MSRHETVIQYCKTLLLAAILCFAVWNIGGHPKSVNAQLAASSGFQFKHITSATNTQAASASVTLHTITLNGGTPGAVAVVDTSAANCSGGTTIAVIATLAGASSQTLAYDIQTSAGLCITSAAATDVTVTYR